jgi:succinate dehydrogenase flavin-adding protein (antitoxin of CptAB toxin-antitoxin module)
MVLLGFLERHYLRLNSVERQAFDALLDEQDPDLANWLWGGGEPPEKWGVLIDRIRASMKA